VFGKPAAYCKGRFNIAHPEIELVYGREYNVCPSALQAVYHSTDKLKGKKSGYQRDCKNYAKRLGIPHQK
jgi:hypothetical protein